MKSFSIILLIIFTAFFASAQKEMSLEQSVLGQYQQFYPTNVFEFSWIGDNGEYAYLENYRTLIIGKVGGKETNSLSIQEVNEKIGTKFNYFAGLAWKDCNQFILNDENIIAFYNISKKEGRTLDLPEKAENITFNATFDKVAYTIDNNLYYSSLDKFEQHVVVENSDKNIVTGQAISRNEMGIDGGIFWAPSGKHLAFYQKDESLVHDYPLLNNEDYPGSLKSIKYPMAGQESERVKVGILTLDKNETVFISPQNGIDYYLTNLAWTPDENYIILAEVARSQDHIWVQKYDRNGKLLKVLFEETSKTWVEPERPAYFPSKTSNDFVWVSERDGFDNLYFYSENGDLKTQLTNNKFPLKSIVASQNGEVYFLATGVSPLNTLLYKVNTKGKQALLTMEEGTHTVSIDAAGKYIFDQFSAHSIPNKAQILDAKGKSVQILVNAENPLAEYGMPEAEINVIKNKNGTDLYTRMIKPKNFDSSKKYPVLIYVYGGPHAQLITNSWLDGGSLWMYWMANQGYIIFTLDNRGSANRGAEFEHVIHRQLGVAENEDQLVGVEYLKNLPFVDANRLAVHGWSFGGFMTCTMLLKSPDLFKVGVAGGAVTDWKYYEIMYGERYMDTPQENPEGYEKTSIINQADQLKSKLLLIHGTIDPVVVMQHTLALTEKFVQLGIQMDYFPYPMHEHNVLGIDRAHLMRKVLMYIMENNK
ncbi:MAG: DPP IV N-terminal domain-containing protein [Brumimicrobium sp.]|nr:DPP IV N-terminal domain-containing protein [Brumimicrobium sp.]